MFFQAEKAAFEEAEKKKEEEVHFDSEKHIWNISCCFNFTNFVCKNINSSYTSLTRCQETKDDPVDSDAEEDEEDADEVSHDSDDESKAEAGEDSDETNKEDVHVGFFILSNMFLNQFE